MADAPVVRRLILNPLLCFANSKISKVDVKRIKSAVNAKYSPVVISEAKAQLLKDCTLLTLPKPLGRYPDRHGENKTVSEINDIVDILLHLDECKALTALPRYVSDNSDLFPSLPLDDGELAFLFAKIDKLEEIIVGLKDAVYTMSAMIAPKPLGLSNVHFPPLTAVHSQSADNHGTSAPRALFVPNTVGKPVQTAQPSHSALPSSAARIESRAWADLVAAHHGPTDESSSAASNYGDIDADGFQRVRSPRHKRKRVAGEQSGHQRHANGSDHRQAGNQLINNSQPRNSRSSTTTSQTSRGPLLFGRKSTSTAPDTPSYFQVGLFGGQCRQLM